MNDKELCVWLRENSSGIYRPAAEAAYRIEELLASQSKAVAVAKPKTNSVQLAEAFDIFWGAGMRKMAKAQARKAFARARPASYSPAEFAEMLAVDIAARLRVSQTGFDAMHPTTYLNNERWDDDIKAPAQLDVLTPLLDCFGAVATAEADDTLAFMRGITNSAADTPTEVQGLLTLEHQA